MYMSCLLGVPILVYTQYIIRYFYTPGSATIGTSNAYYILHPPSYNKTRDVISTPGWPVQLAASVLL